MDGAPQCRGREQYRGKVVPQEAEGKGSSLAQEEHPSHVTRDVHAGMQPGEEAELLTVKFFTSEEAWYRMW